MRETQDAVWTERILQATAQDDWPHILQIIEERYDAKPADGILSEMAHAHFKTEENGMPRFRRLFSDIQCLSGAGGALSCGD